MRSVGSLVFVVASVCAAHSATLSLHAIDDTTARVVVEGEIKEGDANTLHELVETSRYTPLRIASVSFNSGGGNLREGYRLALEIKRAQLATEVANNDICASACFFAFAAGTTKTVGAKARVGVHGAADLKGMETTDAMVATITIARWAAKELGIPSDIIGEMVKTRPNSIVWLSSLELKSMGVRYLEGEPNAGASQPQEELGGEGGPNPSLEWSKLVGFAVDLSKAQNDGVVLTSRFCEAATGICELSVNFRLSGGRSAALRTVEGRNGQAISHGFCLIEPAGDARHCTDWDTRKRRDQRKSVDGAWTDAN